MNLRLIGGELPCPGAPEERERCDAGPCPAWTEWTPWAGCSQTCGGGTRNRVRECAVGRNYDSCVGEKEETEDCGEEKCPTWTEWSDWTVCTQSCGGGRRSKVRECVTGGAETNCTLSVKGLCIYCQVFHCIPKVQILSHDYLSHGKESDLS